MCPIGPRSSLVRAGTGHVMPPPRSSVCQVLPISTAPFVPCSSCTLI